MRISFVFAAGLLGGVLLLAGCETVPMDAPSPGIQIGTYTPDLLPDAEVRQQSAGVTTYLSCTRNLSYDDVVAGTVFRDLRPQASQLTQAQLANIAYTSLPSQCYTANIPAGSRVVDQEIIRSKEGGLVRLEARDITGAGGFITTYAIPLGQQWSGPQRPRGCPPMRADMTPGQREALILACGY